MNSEILITANRLCKTYPGCTRPVVSGLSFSLNAGEVLAFLGPNGAGKTTTIKMLLGLILPSSGTAVILDYDTARASEMRQAMQAVGTVLEGSRNIYWSLSALENLYYFGGLRGLSRKYIKERAHYLLKSLGLYEMRKQPVRKFSRGMQQKVALANALLHDPQILILDEPTLGLDIEAAYQLEEKIKSFAAHGKAVVLTTHDMALAERLSTKTLVLRQGEMAAYDQTSDLLRRFDCSQIVEMKIDGRLNCDLQKIIKDRFPDLMLTSDTGNTNVLWTAPEQCQVIELLNILDDTGQQVKGFMRREPSLEEAFLSLTRQA